MADKRGQGHWSLIFVCIFIILAAIEATQTSYWQVFVREGSTNLKAETRQICFPNQTNTRESLGNVVFKNSTSLCIENTLVVGKFDKTGWNTDFQAEKSLLTVTITSTSAKLMANMLANFVIFVSKSVLKHDRDYTSYQSQVQECARYTGNGFKPNQKMAFKCERIVAGRYFYIWGLGANRIQSAYIDKLNVEFSIKVLLNPNEGVDMTPRVAKEYAISFSHLSGWGTESKGHWIVTLGRKYSVDTVLIGISDNLIKTIGELVVDVGSLDTNGRGSYSGAKKSSLSADKTGFIIKVSLSGNSIRIKGSQGDGLLSDTAVTFLEMMCMADGGGSLYFKDVVKETKKKWYEKATFKPNLKAELQVWQDSNIEVTGWIMIDMISRYMVTGVSLLSGPDAKVVSDLQGLVVATSNFIPNKILSESDKLEADVCGEVGVGVQIIPNKENYLKCLPKPSLGAFVLIYNKLKALRLSALKHVKVFVQMSTVFFFQFKLPDYPRIPSKPPVTSLQIVIFFIQIDYTTIPTGYWVVDLISPKAVEAVVVTAGSASQDLKSFTIYVQDTFTDDLSEVCARFMSKEFKASTAKYFKCAPSAKTGRYVIVARQEKGFAITAISKIEVWFVNGARQEHGTPPMSNGGITTSIVDTVWSLKVDWTIVYNSIRFSTKATGWWSFDLGGQFTVAAFVVTFGSNVEALRNFKDVYIGLTNIQNDANPSICSYFAGHHPHKTSQYSFTCSTKFLYRYAIIRSQLECVKFSLETISNVKLVVQSASNFKHAMIDVTAIGKKIPDTSSAWTQGSALAKMYKDGGKVVYAFEYKTAIDLAMLEISVKKNTKVSSFSIYLNDVNSFKQTHKTCFHHTSSKSEAFYEGSQYKFQCSSTNLNKRFVFLVVQEDFLKTVKFIIKNGGSYQHYIWTAGNMQFQPAPPQAQMQPLPQTPAPPRVQSVRYTAAAGGSQSALLTKRCPTGYTLKGVFCYKAVEIRKYWNEAQDNCMVDGGHLATIMNKVEYDLVDDFIKDKFQRCTTERSNHNFWVGGARCNGQIMWLTKGSAKSFNPNQKTCIPGAVKFGWGIWVAGNPDNMGGNEHCLELVRDGGWRFNDIMCLRSRYCSLCQASPV